MSDELTEAWQTMLEFLPDEVDRDESAARALSLLFAASQIDGSHHKAWVIDQVVRELTGDKYEAFVNTYSFEGINDVNDPEELAAWKAISSGDYCEGDYPQKLVQKVEDGAYTWNDGMAP